MKSALISSLVAAGILATVSANAVASDGTITFNGELTSATCDVGVNSTGSANATVTLPTLSTGSLASTGTTAGATSFTIDLSSCTDLTTSAYAYFESGANVDTTTGRLNNNGTATNVEVQLKDSSGSTIEIGSSNQSTSPVAESLSSGSATLAYSAEYYATGAAGAGTVSTSVTYSIEYI